VVYESQIAELLQYDLEFTIASLYKAEVVEKICAELQKTCKVHMEVDTGMQRTGMRPETAKDVLHYLDQSPYFEITGIYTHLATADSPNEPFAHEQIQAFKNFLDENMGVRKNIVRHMANSGGTTFYPESHLDMVRPGKMTYGYFTTQRHPGLEAIAPVFSVKAHISYFKVVKKGQGIGYGHTHQTQEDTRIVTIPIGYGDGYRRGLSNKAEVLIRGKRYPIVGNICMDQFMVDIHHDEAFVGEEVVLVGKQGAEEITLPELARLCDTIPSEILCNFNNRLPHFYLDSTAKFWEFDSLKHSTWETASLEENLTLTLRRGGV
jgi:alanine racemase